MQKRSCGTKPNRKVLVSFSQEIQVSHLKLKPKITCSWSIHFRQLIYPTPLLGSYDMSCSCHYYRYIILMLDLRLVSFAATEIPPQRSFFIICHRARAPRRLSLFRFRFQRPRPTLPLPPADRAGVRRFMADAINFASIKN